MYIEPNTIIKLCSGVPLDNTYQHSIYFNSHAQQQAFFNSKVKKSFLSGSYQRLNKGVMRIEVKADEIYDCNYLMYQNTNFGNKWFYAFISSIEYVNNIVSEVKFEIDPLQTYWFDTQFKQCFIERTHVSDDTIGKHILTEPFNVNDYVGDNVQHTRITNDKKIVIALSSDPDESSLLTTYGGLYSGIYSD